jgi:hypothetical protein
VPLVRIAKAKPRWADGQIGTGRAGAARRDFYAIARRFEGRFSSAFIRVVDGMRAAINREALERALEQGAVEIAIGTIDFDAWERLGVLLVPAYRAVALAAADDALAQLVRKEPVGDIDPFIGTMNWIDQRAANLVREVSEKQKLAVRELIRQALGRGERPVAILKEIERVVGLLRREQIAVEKRRQDAIASGMDPIAADAMAARYAKRLLKKRGERIARTETVEAQSQGRIDAWRQARAGGQIQPTTKRKWIASLGSERTCEICTGLSGQTTELDGFYFSDVLGADIERPPSHPQCRCTEVLVFS